jgi:hypothetical protein
MSPRARRWTVALAAVVIELVAFAIWRARSTHPARRWG